MERKQMKFCLEFLRTGNATESYKAAGYSPRNDGVAAAAASKLLRNNKVQEYLEQLRKDMDKEIIADAFERRVRLTAILRTPENSISDIIRAIDILNKMDGIYIQKAKVEMGIDDNRAILKYYADHWLDGGNEIETDTQAEQHN